MEARAPPEKKTPWSTALRSCRVPTHPLPVARTETAADGKSLGLVVISRSTAATTAAIEIRSRVGAPSPLPGLGATLGAAPPLAMGTVRQEEEEEEEDRGRKAKIPRIEEPSERQQPTLDDRVAMRLAAMRPLAPAPSPSEQTAASAMLPRVARRRVQTAAPAATLNKAKGMTAQLQGDFIAWMMETRQLTWNTAREYGFRVNGFAKLATTTEVDKAGAKALTWDRTQAKDTLLGIAIGHFHDYLTGEKTVRHKMRPRTKETQAMTTAFIFAFTVWMKVSYKLSHTTVNRHVKSLDTLITDVEQRRVQVLQTKKQGRLFVRDFGAAVEKGLRGRNKYYSRTWNKFLEWVAAEPEVLVFGPSSVEADTPRMTSGGDGSGNHATTPLPSSPDVLATALGFASPSLVGRAASSRSHHQ